MRHALVVGASSGLGLALARKLRGEGYAVTAVARRPPPAGSGLEFEAADLTGAGALEAAIQRAEQARGPLEVLVYSAGEPVMGKTLQVPPEAARRSFEVNFWGLERACRAAVPGMLERGSGQVLAVLSIAALCPLPYEAHYGAAKAACAQYLQSLDAETAGRGVRARFLCPGYVETGFLERGGWAGMEAPRVKGSGITPEQVAEAAFALLGEERAFAVVGWKERAHAVARRLVPSLHARWLSRGVERP